MCKCLFSLIAFQRRVNRKKTKLVSCLNLNSKHIFSFSLPICCSVLLGSSNNCGSTGSNSKTISFWPIYLFIFPLFSLWNKEAREERWRKREEREKRKGEQRERGGTEGVGTPSTHRCRHHCRKPLLPPAPPSTLLYVHAQIYALLPSTDAAITVTNPFYPLAPPRPFAVYVYTYLYIDLSVLSLSLFSLSLFSLSSFLLLSSSSSPFLLLSSSSSAFLILRFVSKRKQKGKAKGKKIKLKWRRLRHSSHLGQRIFELQSIFVYC